MGSGKYQHLLSSGQIAGLKLKNRFVLAAMGSQFAEENGHCADRLWDYYEARAKGGTGLLILETSSVAYPAACSMPRMVAFSSEEYLPGLQELTRRVHRHGAKIAAQLNHSGKVAQEDVVAGRPVWVPSIPKRTGNDMFRALTNEEIGTFIKAAGPDGKGPRYHPMTVDDIEQLVQQFVNAAQLAVKAGFDAVEIHAGHGYVLSSFLSPYANQRTDEYGGSLENRARLLTEVLSAVRQAVGEEFPILVRLDAKEFRLEEGITPAAAVKTAQLAEAAGASAIDVSAYAKSGVGIAFTEAPLVHAENGFLAFAESVRQAVSIPVIAVGRLDLELADRKIAANRIDFVALGRPLLAEPELVNKLAAGRERDVRPCIYCYVCVSNIFLNQPMCCAANPGTGRESTLGSISKVASAQRIAVVGGGPAGLEAARVLAERGHEVVLWEREKDLGGTARIAALPYKPNGDMVNYLTEAVQQLPIEIRLGEQVDADRLLQHKPAHVVVATGALRAAPDLPGNDLDHVFDSDRLRGVLLGGDSECMRGFPWHKRLMVSAARLTGITRNIDWLRTLSHVWMPLGKRIVLVGGGLVGVELAEYLAHRGRQVTVIEPGEKFGIELSVVRRWRVLHDLESLGVQLIKSATINEITRAGVRCDVDGESQTVAADQVIIAMGAQADLRLQQALVERGLAASAVGDCQNVGYIEGALKSARELAVRL